MVDKDIPSPEEIEQFLKIFKASWDGKIIIREDPRNDETLTILGIKPKHRAEEIKKLRDTDYFNGPTPDHDGEKGKEWWEFGMRVKGREIYIKIRIYKKENGTYGGKCMSFHFPDRKINYPYKKDGDEHA